MTGRDDRVVWDEGMMLTPQHFQQWERWVTAELHERGRALAPFRTGFTDLEIDRGALAGGQLALRGAAGLFADGTTFACPERDALPTPCAAAERIPAGKDGITVHLALPRVANGAPSHGDESAATPFVRRRRRVADQVRPEAEREIATASLRLSLRCDGEPMDGFHTLPVARLLRATGGGLEVAGDFLPPALTLAAAPLATTVLRQILGMLAQKWTDLASKRRSSGGGIAEAASLMLQHTVGGALPGLRHCLEHATTAPADAFVQLATLAARMCTFHGKLSVLDLPTYQHADAGPGFRALATTLQELLGEAAPTRCTEIPLERQGETMFSARIPSPNLLTGSRLYLSVKAEATEAVLQSRLPVLAKVASKDRLQELLMRAVPGLPLRVVSQPPAAIPVQAGRTYFVLEPVGEQWDAIVASLTLAIHVSPGLDQLRIELLAVKE